MADFRMDDVARFEDAIMDARADLAALDLILEVAVPDDDASKDMGLDISPDLHRVVMTHDIHRALLRAVMHVRRDVEAVHALFQDGGCAAMQRGMDIAA